MNSQRDKWQINALGRRACHAALLVLFAGLTVAPSSCSRPAKVDASQPGPAVVVGVAPVKRQDISNDLKIASEFIPYQEIDVHAKVSGYIKKLYINWGTHVKAGQLMAVLDVPELNAQVLRDTAAVARDKQELARTREELASGESAANVAHLTYSRLNGVIATQPGLVAQEEVDVAQAKAEETAASVSAARDALAAAQQELAVDHSTLARDQDLQDYATITAPFNGVVTQLNAYTGSLLPAGTSSSQSDLPLCHLSQNDLLRLVIPVPAQVVPDVRIGETVKVDVPSLNRSFEGKVARVSGQIDLDTRTMHTEVEVPNPSYQLVPGMYASVELPVRSAVNALAVPIQSVSSTQPGKGTVLVVENGQIAERDVTLGIETATEAQVLSGLHEGEMVVFGEPSRYHPGEAVRPEPVNLAALGEGQ